MPAEEGLVGGCVARDHPQEIIRFPEQRMASTTSGKRRTPSANIGSVRRPALAVSLREDHRVEAKLVTVEESGAS